MRIQNAITLCFALSIGCGNDGTTKPAVTGVPDGTSGGPGGASPSPGGAGAGGVSAGGVSAGGQSSTAAGGALIGGAGQATAAGAGGLPQPIDNGSGGTNDTGATSLDVYPAELVLPPSTTRALLCNVPCSYAVAGSMDGLVTTNGLYTAPSVPGTYHVIASGQVAGRVQTATVTVTVPPPATGAVGVWEYVTAPEMDPGLFTGVGSFGVGSIVVDPGHATDMYVGGYGSIWKSTDYGFSWKRLNCSPNPPYLALGHVLAVAGTTPATLWMASPIGAQHVYRSKDGGASFTLTGTVPEAPDSGSLYSIVVDPYDNTHLITGLHEQDKVLESTNSGDTWKFVSGSGWPGGGKSWFPFFVNTGSADGTRKTWFAIAQDGGSAVMTSDGGATWVEPKGIQGLNHPHGNTGFYQNGKTLVAAGVGGPGEGVYRSTDLGANWTRVTQGSGGVVWGTSKNLYVMWSWACSGCGTNEGGPKYQTSPNPGDAWKMGVLPSGLTWGPNSVAVSNDGQHNVFVGAMWATGLWRYVEP